MKLRLESKLARRGLAVVAALALGASVVVGREQPVDRLAAVAPPVGARAGARAPLELDLDKLARPVAALPSEDPFAPRSFAAPAPAAASADPVPAAPSAPPLPFTYVGRMEEDGELAVFLTRGAESFAVKPGQKLAGEYRLERATDTEVTFTYLPLGTRQSLTVAPTRP